MDYLSGVVEKVKKLKKPNETFLIAIDGFGGSGKSILARDLKKYLDKIAKTTIVEIDDFHDPDLKRKDRKRLLRQVIIPLKEGKKAKYQRYDWGTKQLAEWNEIEPNGVVIIEGLPSMHPDLGKYDFTIWLNMPQEEAAKRGINRDLNEYKVDTKEQWEKDWMPQEKEYVEKFNPETRADVVIDIKF